VSETAATRTDVDRGVEAAAVRREREGAPLDSAGPSPTVPVAPPPPPTKDDGDPQWQEKLLRQLRTALQNAVTLEIVTAVGAVTTDANGRPTPDLKNADVALTKVDMLLGDITTVLPEEFVTGRFQSMRDFHKEREKQGHQLVKDNIEALGKLIEKVREWLK
jgi:hypothetical protein